MLPLAFDARVMRGWLDPPSTPLEHPDEEAENELNRRTRAVVDTSIAKRRGGVSFQVVSDNHNEVEESGNAKSIEHPKAQ
jgi:hypothetical protein